MRVSCFSEKRTYLSLILLMTLGLEVRSMEAPSERSYRESEGREQREGNVPGSDVEAKSVTQMTM